VPNSSQNGLCSRQQTVTPPLVGPLLDGLHPQIKADRESDPPTALAVTADRLLRAIQLRTYPPMPDSEDRGEQVVITVYGVDLSVRRSDDGLFVHIDSSDMPECWRPLIVEVNCAGESHYHDVTGCGGACHA
jgi:hypothetical protein